MVALYDFGNDAEAYAGTAVFCFAVKSLKKFEYLIAILGFKSDSVVLKSYFNKFLFWVGLAIRLDRPSVDHPARNSDYGLLLRKLEGVADEV